MSHPDAKRTHGMMERLSVRPTKSLTDTSGLRMGSTFGRRFAIHCIPRRCRWLNPVEIETGVFTRQCLGIRGIPDLRALRRHCKAWVQRVSKPGTKNDFKF